MSDHPLYAVIVAGGSGSRMGGDIPKQFLEIGKIPVLMRTIRCFHDFNPDIQLLVVLPETQKSAWHSLCREHGFDIYHRVITGGTTRFQSVKNGIEAIREQEGLVAIHDAVRPFVTKEVISRSYESASLFGSGIAAVRPKDSVREDKENGSTRSLDRSRLWVIQTPQTFRLQGIKKAFEKEESPLFTDDATVAETAGYPVRLVEGDYHNFKITTPEDITWANFLLSKGHL